MTTTITLNEQQIVELVSGKSIKIGDNNIELLKDDILINVNGFEYYPSAVHIEYKEYSNECELVAERLQ